MDSFYPLPTNQKVVFFFNSAAATLWFCCLCRFLILLPLVGRRFLPGGIADFFHVVSLTPLIGFLLVKSSLHHLRRFVTSDIWSLLNGVRMAWICYGVIFPHPKIAKHTSYSILIFSWCIQYLFHYSYHSFRIKTKSSPHFLFWIQYHIHYITFPMSLISEMILIFLSLGFVKDGSIYEIVLQVCLLSYIPVAYFAWGHLQQRRNIKYIKVMEKRKESANRTDRNVDSGTTSSLPQSTDNVLVKFDAFGVGARNARIFLSQVPSTAKVECKVLTPNSKDEQQIKVTFKDKHVMTIDPTTKNINQMKEYFDAHSRKMAIEASIRE
ncbi:hypothetical protein JA1_000989 [Spathaspora sp. JA1]|nr:hypothetical protein JA1_000989 [Spathaspora sp. JA1]